MKTISTKEIRNDLEGFLKKLKGGQTFQVMYRSKPLVTIAAKEEADAYLAKDAGSPAAIKRSVDLAMTINGRRQGHSVLDPNKSIKQLYEETQDL